MVVIEYRAVAQNGNHYYESFAGINTDQVSRPYFPTQPAILTKSRSHLRKAVTNLGALKNLLSIFVYIGNKFGGNELRTKIFLTPAQIYNNLVDFMVNCAYTPYLKDATGANLTRLNTDKMQFEAGGVNILTSRRCKHINNCSSYANITTYVHGR
ncbi:220 kDa polyprotein [Faustovirus ST1]|nr:220 kDa polyprotein [Faustovirus ST1]